MSEELMFEGCEGSPWYSLIFRCRCGVKWYLRNFERLKCPCGYFITKGKQVKAINAAVGRKE